MPIASLNVAKTEFMLIGSKQMIKSISNSQLNVKIENKSIKQVYETKTLGVTIDQHLSWRTNTENICKKITSGISALRPRLSKMHAKTPICFNFFNFHPVSSKFSMNIEHIILTNRMFFVFGIATFWRENDVTNLVPKN